MRIERHFIDFKLIKINNAIQNLIAKESKAFNWKSFFICLALLILSIIHIYFYSFSNWSIPSKFLVSILPVWFWVIIEDYFKNKKSSHRKLLAIQELKNNAKIEVFSIHANKVALLDEYEDEGVCYLIEMKNGECLYLWDNQYNFPNCFPNDYFEYYLNKVYSYCVDETILCLGSKINFIDIDGNSKWNYFSKRGFPSNFEPTKGTFDQTIQEIIGVKK